MDETINSSDGSMQGSPAKVAPLSLPPEALCLDALIDNAIEPLKQLAALPEGLLPDMPHEAQRLLSQLETLKADRARVAAEPELFDVAEQVAHAYHITPEILRSKRRHSHVSFVRQIAFHLCREVAAASFPEIGAHFNRDHSTVIHGCKKIKMRMTASTAFKSSIDRLRHQIEQRSTNGQPHIQGDAANI